jgi:DNA-binding SARP family transcriptional activator
MDYSVLADVTVRHDSWVAYLPPQSQLLAAILVVAEGKPVARATLGRMLYDGEEDSPKSPEDAVKGAVHYLRSRLRLGPITGDPLPCKGDTYRLKLREDEADVLRFRAKTDQARRSTGREATELMRAALSEWGPDATGLFGGNPFTGLRARWADTNREKLRREYRDACFHCLRQKFEAREFGPLAAECLGLANESAAWCDEPFIGQWMVATYLAGNQSQAEWIYQNAMNAAIADLGGPLSPWVSKLAERIRTGDDDVSGPADFLETELLRRNSSTERRPMSNTENAPDHVSTATRDLLGEDPAGDDLPPRLAEDLTGPETEPGESPAADSGSAPADDPADGERQQSAAAGTSVVLNGQVIAHGSVFGTQVNNYGRPR